jgi:tetratricopeptide (TPR) repeat protein
MEVRVVPDSRLDHGRAAALVAALLLTAVPSHARAESLPWGAANAQALAAEEAGRFAEAADLLAPFQATYRQDYGFVMRLAWASYRAGRYELALPLYEQGVTLSGGAVVAKLGEGWTLLQLGRADAARGRFAAVLDVEPENASAREGLDLASTPVAVLSPHGSVSIHSYSSHPSKDWGVGGGVGLDAWLAERGYLAVDYRFTHVATRSTRFVTVEPFDQHEVWAGAGVGWPIAGLTLRYGYVDDGSGTLGGGHVIGGAARVSPYGDIVADATYTLWDDESVFRVGLGYRIPIGSWVAVRPFGALQAVEEELLFMGGGALEVGNDRFGVSAHGRGGAEERPALAELGVVYDFYERIDLGVGGAAWMRLGDSVRLSASYEYLGLSFDDAVFGYDSGVHLFTVGVEARAGVR